MISIEFVRLHRNVLFAGILLLIPAKVRAVDDVAGNLIRFNDNGAWSWFQDERAIINGNQILVGSSANSSGINGTSRGGDVELSVFDLTSRSSNIQVLSQIQGDDHNSPALLVRPDGRYLAMYSNHNSDDLSRYRVSVNPGDATSWQPEQTFNNGIGATYSNTFYLSAENKTYDFTRTNGFDPNFLVSSNQGSSWSYGGWLVKDGQEGAGGDSVRPYAKYTSNGVDKIYFTVTNAHPANYNNSIYAGYLQGGNEYRMDGTLVGPAGTDFNSAPVVTSFTPVFTAQPDGVIGNRTHAWTTDMALDSSGNPYTIFTSRVETDNNASTADVTDHRFYYARWNGSSWDVHELAKAGNELYSGQGDYTGLVALDPNDPNTVYISSAINPATQATTAFHEIYKGVTSNNGASWSWTPITQNSTVDNLRPIVPKGNGSTSALMWFRGTYTSYTDYHASIVGLVSTPANNVTSGQIKYVDATTSNTTLANGSSATFTGPAAGQGSSTDNLWDIRTGFGNSNTLLTSSESTQTENAPKLRTSVSGLAKGSYDVWAYFWSNKGETWRLQAGLDPNNLLMFDKDSAEHIDMSTLIGATTDHASDDIEYLYQAYLGRISLDGSNPLLVYIDDGGAAGASRTWYDGVGYAVATPEPCAIGLLAFCGITLVRRRPRYMI